MEKSIKRLDGLMHTRVKELVLDPNSGESVWNTIKEGMMISLEYHIPVRVIHNVKEFKINPDTLMNLIFEQDK